MGFPLRLKSFRPHSCTCDFPECMEKAVGEYKTNAICRKHIELVKDLNFLGVLKDERDPRGF